MGVFARPLLDRAGTRSDARQFRGRGNRAARASLKPRWFPAASRGFVTLIGAARTRLAKTPRLPLSLAVARGDKSHAALSYVEAGLKTALYVARSWRG